MIHPVLIDTQSGAAWQSTLEEMRSGRGAVTFRVFARHTSPSGATDDRYYEADSLDLARAIRSRAISCLRRGRVPDLQEIARDLKRRTPELATGARKVHRNAGGVVLLGDTPPDERPELLAELRSSVPRPYGQ